MNRSSSARHVEWSARPWSLLHGPGHLIALADRRAVVLFFGWKQLPDMARSVGRSLRIFKTEIKGMSEDDKAPGEAARTPRSHPRRRPSQPPSPRLPPAGPGARRSAELAADATAPPARRTPTRRHAEPSGTPRPRSGDRLDAARPAEPGTVSDLAQHRDDSPEDGRVVAGIGE